MNGQTLILDYTSHAGIRMLRAARLRIESDDHSFLFVELDPVKLIRHLEQGALERVELHLRIRIEERTLNAGSDEANPPL